MARLAALALLVLFAVSAASATACSIVGTWTANGVIVPSPGLSLVLNGTATYDSMGGYHATGLTASGASDCLVTLTATYSFTGPAANGNYTLNYYGGSWSLNTGALCPLLNIQFQAQSPIANATVEFDPTSNCTAFWQSTSTLTSHLVPATMPPASTSGMTSFATSAFPAAILVFALLAAIFGLY